MSESLEGLDPEIAALVGAAPEDGTLDLSHQVAEENPIPTKKELAAEKAAADQVPTVHDQDRTAHRQIGKYWASIVPGATMAIVYHKPHSGPGAGALRIINRFNIRDIQAGGGDVTLFTLNNLSPTWGPGDYHYYVVDPKTHREHHVAHVPVAEKPSGAKETEEMSLANTLMQHILNDAREQKKATMSHQPPDPFAQLIKAQELMKTLTGGEGKTDPLLLMMVMLMQPKPEPPKIDPVLATLLDRMDRRMEAMEKKAESAASAGPPPPPPPPTPQVDVVEVIAKLAPLLKPEPPPKPEVTAMDLVRILQEQYKNDERLGLKDVIGLIDRREARERPEATLAEKIQEFVALRELSGQAFGGGGGGETNFWDAVSRFLEHPALGAGVGRAIEASAKNRGPQNPVVLSNRPAPQAPPRQMQAPAAPAGHIAAQAQQAPQAGDAAEEEAPKIPAAVQQHLQAMQDSLQIPNEIESRKARVLATIQTLVVLWNDPNWNKFVVELLTHVTQNNKEMALKGLGGFLGFMHYHGLLDPAAGKAAYLDFRETWDELQPELTKSLGGFLQMVPKGPSSEEADEGEEASEEAEESEEETDEELEPEPAKTNGGPALFVTSLPQDDIESLYQQAQKNVI